MQFLALLVVRQWEMFDSICMSEVELCILISF